MSGARTRTGCYTCRLRKKKCDEQKPFCLVCRSRDIQCYAYGVKPEWMHGMGSWREIMESKEAKFIRESAEKAYKSRRQGQNIKKKQNGHQLIAQESSGSRQVNLQAARATATPIRHARMESMQVVEPNDVFPVTKGQNHHHLPGSTLLRLPTSMDNVWSDNSLPSLHLVPRFDMRLVMTFLDVIFPSQLTFHGFSRTTDRSWRLHALIDTDPLYQASQSATVTLESEIQNGNQNGVSDLDSDARRLQIGALQGLQQRVDELCTEIYYGEELLRRGIQTLAIMTQLVSLDKFSFAEGQWEMHLQAARIILGMFQNKWAPELFAEKGIPSRASSIGEALTDRYSADVLKALEIFITSFLWVDIIANATYGPPPLNSMDFNYLPLLKNGHLRPQENMGCQSCILIIITEITAIEAWKEVEIERGCLSVVQLVMRATTLNDRLTLGIQSLDGRLCINPTSLEAESEAVNLIFSYAALVYLHTIVSGASPHTPEIKYNVTHCLARLEALPPHLLVRTCWPFTIAGCMAVEDQYDRFREILAHPSAPKLELGTTLKGLKVMEECWRLRKFEPGMWCWRSTMKKMNMKILLI